MIVCLVDNEITMNFHVEPKATTESFHLAMSLEGFDVDPNVSDSNRIGII